MNQQQTNNTQPKQISIFRKTELHRLITREDWKIAKMQCQSHPHQAKIWSIEPTFFDGRWQSTVLPIHQACALHPSEEMIQSLVTAYPQGVKEVESRFGRLPLHVACRSRASFGVIQALLVYHPQGVMKADDAGRIPLHYALSNGASPEVIELLLEGNEECAKISDERGWLALHVACFSGSSCEVIKSLIESYPESLKMCTRKGTTVVQCLEMHHDSRRREEIKALLVSNEEEKTKDPFDDLVGDHMERRNSSFRSCFVRQNSLGRILLDDMSLTRSSSFIRMM